MRIGRRAVQGHGVPQQDAEMLKKKWQRGQSAGERGGRGRRQAWPNPESELDDGTTSSGQQESQHSGLACPQ